MKTKIILISIFMIATNFLFAKNPEWIIFTNDSVPWAEDLSVSNIIVDDDNNKWIEGFGIVTVYNNHLWSNPLKSHYYDFYENIIEFRDIVFNYENSIWLIGNLIIKLRPGIDTVSLVRNEMPTITFFGGLSYNGYLWIGSDTGLIRYNGTNYITLNRDNGLLPTNNICNLKNDTSGVFWMASDTGLIRWDMNNWTIYNTSNSAIPFKTPRKISIDKNGDKWLTFSDPDNTCKFAKFDGTNFTIFDSTSSNVFSNSGYGGQVNGIAFDSSGNKWISTDFGLVKYNDTTFTFFDIPVSAFRAKMCICVAVDKNDNIWVGTYECLAVYNPNGVYFSPRTKKDDDPLNTIKTQFFPNPTERKININYQIEKPGIISCDIYDENGKFISKAFDKTATPGEYNETIDTGNLPNGTYLFKMKIGNRIETKKVVIAK